MSSSEAAPLSNDAQDAKELMQEQLLRKMALKMVAAAEEDERARRISEEAHPDTQKNAAYDKLIVVQEDLVRTLNLLKVKAETELEQGQRVTEDKKRDVHDELIRKAASKQVHEEEEQERTRRIAEEKDDKSEESKERLKTYNKLVNVQEDLLKRIQAMKVDEATKQEQQRRITEERKLDMQQQLVHAVGMKKADVAMDSERKRRVDETLGDEEIKRRVAIANKLIDVQKELLATHKPTKPITGTSPSQVLDDLKFHFQEELLRKSAQKEAITAMEEERQRRVVEAPLSPKGGMSDAQAEVLEAITRQASKKQANAMAEEARQDYIQAEAKSRAQEETVRVIHQKQVDKAMEDERKTRVDEMSGKEPPHVTSDLKKEIEKHAK